jgi:dATP pyrophosphohydrolase
MARQPHNVLVIPYYREEETIKFAIFKRRRAQIWQWIAGGVEDNESFIDTAIRECYEEANITDYKSLIELDTMCSVRADIFKQDWPKEIYTVTEHSLAVELVNMDITISDEHTEYRWVTYDEALEMLKYDSNKTAMWELMQRLAIN